MVTEPSRDVVYSDYISEIEEKCKNSINNGNVIGLANNLEVYMRLSKTIGDRREWFYNNSIFVISNPSSNTEISNCSSLIADSLFSILLYHLKSDNKFNERRNQRLSNEIVHAIQKSYVYSYEAEMDEYPNDLKKF